MRLFLGIEVPSVIKDFLSKSYAPIQFSPKGWELPQDYHLTLLFIGETNQTDEIIQRMQKIKLDSFELKTSTLEFFPRRILYQSFYPSQGLLNLLDKVEREFSEWVDPKAKAFTPHLTVKRFQRYEYNRLKSLIEQNRFDSQSFKVNKLTLFKSEKDQGNQKYHILAESSLDNDDMAI